MKPLRISLLHLASVPGAIEANRRLIENATQIAASYGDDWVVSPELAVCGYGFTDLIETDWIMPEPGEWMSSFCEVVRALRVNVFLSHPEREPEGMALYNSVFFIHSGGAISARHRKINTASDGWSSAGSVIEPAEWNGTKVGVRFAQMPILRMLQPRFPAPEGDHRVAAVGHVAAEARW